MQDTTYYCDICGKEFHPSKLTEAHLFGYNMDFCDECQKELRVKFNELKNQRRGTKND